MKSTIRGMFLLGQGKPEGMNEFSNSIEAFINALSPWIVLIAARNFLPLILMQSRNLHSILISVAAFLVEICCILMTIVIIHFYSKLWDKEENWQQTTTSLLWCFWVPVIDLILFSMICGVLFGSFPNIFVFLLALASVLYIAYSLWLNWFVIRTGLQLTTGKAIYIVVTIVASSMILYSVFITLNYDYIKHRYVELQQQMQQAQSIH